MAVEARGFERRPPVEAAHDPARRSTIAIVRVSWQCGWAVTGAGPFLTDRPAQVPRVSPGWPSPGGRCRRPFRSRPGGRSVIAAPPAPGPVPRPEHGMERKVACRPPTRLARDPGSMNNGGNGGTSASLAKSRSVPPMTQVCHPGMSGLSRMTFTTSPTGASSGRCPRFFAPARLCTLVAEPLEVRCWVAHCGVGVTASLR